MNLVVRKVAARAYMTSPVWGIACSVKPRCLLTHAMICPPSFLICPAPDDARRNSGKVLVHCVGGISRSVAVTLAYLMRTENMKLDDAYTFMKSKKANISPNISFMGQLLEFEKAELERLEQAVI